MEYNINICNYIWNTKKYRNIFLSSTIKKVHYNENYITIAIIVDEPLFIILVRV